MGILGNAADFSENSPNDLAADDDNLRRQMMIAFDMRYVATCKLQSDTLNII